MRGDEFAYAFSNAATVLVRARTDEMPQAFRRAAAIVRDSVLRGDAAAGKVEDDLVDFARAQGKTFAEGHAREAIRDVLRNVDDVVESHPAAQATTAEVSSPVASRLVSEALWQPFPVEALAPRLRDFVVEAADAIGCDPSLVALPALAAAASAIGNTRRILLKPGWSEPSILWTATIGESGTAKSPAYEAALTPLMRREEVAHRGGTDDPKPPRLMVSDVTIEALAVRLRDAPRGLLLARDELAGWLRSFDAYRSGRGGDAAHWLQLHGGRSLTVDRKSADAPKVFVPRAAVSITGSVQPATLAKCLGREHFDDGLAARLLVAMPQRRPKRWTSATIAPATDAAYGNALDGLLALEFESTADGGPTPVDLPLTDEAKPAWIEFYNEFAARQHGAVGDEAAALAKLEGAAARLALVHQLLIDPSARAVGVESIRAGTRLARWFADEVDRVYSLLDETSESAQRRRLVEWIASRGGRVTLRDVVKDGPRRFRVSDTARSALETLVAGGFGAWSEKVPGENGGRPSRVFVLNHPDVVRPPGDVATQPLGAATESEVLSPSPEVHDAEADDGSGDRP